MSLYDLKPGESGRVAFLGSGGPIRQRLMDMGILPNVAVTVSRVAPAGGPMWIEMEGTQLALRRREAEAVGVTAS